MNHSISIKGYASLEELAKDIANLRYDAMGKVVYEFAKDLQKQADKDLSSGKIKLAREGYKAAEDLINAYDHIKEMLERSRKPMKNDLEERSEIK